MPKYLSATLTGEARSVRTSRGGSIVRGIALALLGSLAVALAAHVAVPLPWTPVPLTLQPMAVLLIGLLFGPSLGFATLTLYLVEGAMGLPVFQPLGPGGVLQLMGPTGGFLWSYPLVALIAGAAFRSVRNVPRFAAATLAGSLAMAMLYFCGAAQFSASTHLNLRRVLMAAVLPFLPGEAIKVVAAASAAAAWSTRERR